MSHAKKLIAKCLSALMAVLIVAGMGILAYAASDSVSVRLSVRQTFVNHTTLQAEDTFSYVLTPLETGNPMPGQSADSYSFTINGTEEVKLAEIPFTRPGVYRYELKQTIENEKKGYTYDGEVYTLEIYVTNDADGGLTATTVAYMESDKKADQISFENSYRKDAASNALDGSPETGDSSNPTLWFVLLAFSAIGFAGTRIISKIRRPVKSENRAR